MNKDAFEVAKYHKKWAIFANGSKTFHFIGKGKKFCEKKVKELNQKK